MKSEARKDEQMANDIEKKPNVLWDLDQSLRNLISLATSVISQVAVLRAGAETGLFSCAGPGRKAMEDAYWWAKENLRRLNRYMDAVNQEARRALPIVKETICRYTSGQELG